MILDIVAAILNSKFPHNCIDLAPNCVVLTFDFGRMSIEFRESLFSKLDYLLSVQTHIPCDKMGTIYQRDFMIRDISNPSTDPGPIINKAIEYICEMVVSEDKALVGITRRP